MLDEPAADSKGPSSQLIHLISLFPRILDSWMLQGVVSRAIQRELVEIRVTDLRPFGIGRHHVTDDYPFGGGVGMVLKPEPVFEAVESLKLDSNVPVILLSPRGRTFNHGIAEELAHRGELVLIAGHYEGIDERIRQHLITDELSVGDYVLSSGELAAMIVMDAVVRLLPGAITESAADDESFSTGMLEYPHYTRPANFRGWSVPDVLLSGHHAEIARWRRRQAHLTTLLHRPDLFAGLTLSKDDEEDLRK